MGISFFEDYLARHPVKLLEEIPWAKSTIVAEPIIHHRLLLDDLDRQKWLEDFNSSKELVQGIAESGCHPPSPHLQFVPNRLQNIG